MAGAILGTPLNIMGPAEMFFSNPLIKLAEIVNECDLVGVDTNGFVVVASKTQAAIVKALGAALFVGNNSTNNVRTGDGTTILCGIARKCRVYNVNSTTVPGLGKGKPVFLGPVTTTTVSNYTCTQTTTDGDELQHVGYVSPDGTYLEIDFTLSGFKYQTAGNSTVGNA